MKTTESISSMDDIIFEKRNKMYGAYELRRNYNQRLFRSFIISICFMVSIFLFSHIRKVTLPNELFTYTKDSVIFSNNFVVQQFHRQENQPVQQLSRPDEHAFIAVTDTVDKKEVKDTTSSTNVTFTVNPGGVAGGSSDTAAAQPYIPMPPTVRTMASVDKIPEFPGGLEKFYAFLLKRIHYTHEAMHAGVKGKMYVRFVIDEEGMVRSITLASKIGYGLDEQVQSVLAESPKWTPGMVSNSAVKTEMVLPVSFNLK